MKKTFALVLCGAIFLIGAAPVKQKKPAKTPAKNTVTSKKIEVLPSPFRKIEAIPSPYRTIETDADLRLASKLFEELVKTHPREEIRIGLNNCIEKTRSVELIFMPEVMLEILGSPQWNSTFNAKQLYRYSSKVNLYIGVENLIQIQKGLDKEEDLRVKQLELWHQYQLFAQGAKCSAKYLPHPFPPPGAQVDTETWRHIAWSRWKAEILATIKEWELARELEVPHLMPEVARALIVHEEFGFAFGLMERTKRGALIHPELPQYWNEIFENMLKEFRPDA